MPELLSHTLAIGLSIAVIVAMVSVLNIIRQNDEQGVAQDMAENICYQLKLAAESLSTGSHTATVHVGLPARFGSEAYTVYAVGHSINITSASASSGCVAGVPFDLKGSATGGDIVLTLSGDEMALSGA